VYFLLGPNLVHRLTRPNESFGLFGVFVLVVPNSFDKRSPVLKQDNAPGKTDLIMPGSVAIDLGEPNINTYSDRRLPLPLVEDLVEPSLMPAGSCSSAQEYDAKALSRQNVTIEVPGNRFTSMHGSYRGNNRKPIVAFPTGQGFLKASCSINSHADLFFSNDNGHHIQCVLRARCRDSLTGVPSSRLEIASADTRPMTRETHGASRFHLLDPAPRSRCRG
jgi:hypothetical protein